VRPVGERLAGWFPAVVAFGLPTVFIPNLIDAYILPRASLVIAGACIGAGLALLIAGRPGLGSLRWPVVAAVVAALLALAFSVSWPLSLTGSYTRYESLPMRLGYLGLLAVPVWLLRDERSRRWVLAGFVFGTSIACIEAVYQQLNQVPFRPDGNLGNASLLGALVAMAVPPAVARSLQRGRFEVAWWLALPVLAAGLYVSTSRAGGLGAVAGCAVLLALKLRGRLAAVAMAGAAAVVPLGLLLILLSPLKNLNGDPGPTRLHLWSDSLHLIAARPLTGWGEDATGLVLGRFLTGDWAAPDVTFDRVHSGLLDLAATQGLVGVAALGWVLFVVGREAWRSRRLDQVAPLAAALAGYSVWVMFNFDWAPATGVFWLLAGTCWSAVRAADPAAAPAPARARGETGYARRAVGAAALALAAVLLAAMPILSDAWYAQGRPDLAARADPLQAQYRRALGEDLLAGGSRTEGIQELRLAAQLGSTDPSLYVELGDAELQAGDVAAARADYQTALTIDPYWAPARQRLSGKGGPPAIA
jgi:hypothetical protein